MLAFDRKLHQELLWVLAEEDKRGRRFAVLKGLGVVFLAYHVVNINAPKQASARVVFRKDNLAAAAAAAFRVVPEQTKIR